MANKTTIAAFLAASAIGTQTAQTHQATPDVVKIGLIDTKIDDKAERPGISVEYRAFHSDQYNESLERISAAKTHGDVVVDTIATMRKELGDTRSYKIYAANPFGEKDEKLHINYQALDKILDWYKANDVKIIATTFATTTPNATLAAFVDRAKNEGFTVLASVGNGASNKVPYPAAFPDVIAVDGHFYASKRGNGAPFVARADVIFDGDSGYKNRPNGQDRSKVNDDIHNFSARDRLTPVVGSSFAVARAAAFIAAHAKPKDGLEENRELVRNAMQVPGRPVYTANFKIKPTIERFASIGPAALQPAHNLRLLGAEK